MESRNARNLPFSDTSALKHPERYQYLFHSESVQAFLLMAPPVSP
jgi:hypothetical protein